MIEPRVVTMDLLIDLPAPPEKGKTDPIANGKPEPVAAESDPQGMRLKATNGPTVEVIERARLYLQKIDPGIQGKHGSNPTMWAARAMVYGFDLGIEQGLALLLSDYNHRCSPQWSEKELRHKCEDADKNDFSEPRGWLKNEKPETTSGPAKQAKPVDPAKWQGMWRTKSFTLTQLMETEYPPANFVVPGIMSEGMNLLAGKPKTGKSWFALNLALTISMGGHALGTTPVAVGDVLYLSLEDRLRRIQDRARKVMQGLGFTKNDRLRVAVEWPRIGQGGVEMLDEWAEATKAAGGHPTLIIVDVWAKFKPVQKGGSKSAYDVDYEQVEPLKNFVDKHKTNAFLLHHCKKAKAEDVLDEISGTLGLAGSMDGAMILTRARSENEAELFITGRDIEEQALALEFDPKAFSWRSMGKANERTECKYKQQAIDVFKANTGLVLGAPEIADKIGVPVEKRGYFRVILGRMCDEGLIERTGNGRFRWPVAGVNGESSF